jgi:hypothetical protein
MNLTQEEIERYSPYHTMAAFKHGFEDYTAGRPSQADRLLTDGRAYDRGAECAMRRQRKTA